MKESDFYIVLNVVHTWCDARRDNVKSVIPSNGNVLVYCTEDLSKEAAKVCSFISMITRQTWTYRTQIDAASFIITFFQQKITLEDLFEVKH